MMARPLSLLFFSNALQRGGAEEHVLTLLRGLDRRRFRLHLVCTPQVAEKLQPDIPGDVEVLPLYLRKPTHLAAASRFAKILRERQVDILHSHLFYSSLFASPIGRLCRVPLIVETPHVREAWRRGWFKSRFVIDRLVGRFVDYYIAVSHANARYLIQHKALPARKIVVIHNGCDLSRFDRPQPVHVLRHRLGLAEEELVVMVIGRLEPQKGHRLLLEALPAVRRQFPRVRLICVGEGSLREELERQAFDLGIGKLVRFVGAQSNVADWLALADLTVLPSFYEGLPLVAIESLAAGRPLVATAVDGTPEVVVDGKTGLTVPPGDPQSLAEAVCRLLGDSPLRHELGDAGRQWVRSHFSQERQLRRTQAFYLAAWRQRHTPAKGRRRIPLGDAGVPRQSTPRVRHLASTTRAR